MKKRFLVKAMGLALALSMCASFVACKDAEKVDEGGSTVSENTDEKDGFESIISQLEPGQAYAYADICSEYDALLVAEDGAFDNHDGNMAAVKAKIYGFDANGKVIEYGESESSSTANPLAVYDGCLMSITHTRAMMEYIDGDAFSMITKKVVEESTDADGNTTYGFMDADTQTEGTMDDDSMMLEMLDNYSKAKVINFTVVE